MVKKLMMAFLLLLLPVIALADAQVFDEINLFSDSEIARMNEIITQVEAEHQVDLAVLATMSVPDDYSESMWKIRDYADDYYDHGGFGMGEDFSGMLIMLDMNNRAMWLSTGGVMIEYINDNREEAILDDAYDYLSVGRYGEAMIAALNRTARYMDQGRAEGTFLYDEVTGKRLGGIYNALTTGEIGLAAVVGAGAALIFFLSISGSYNLSGSTYSYDRGANASVKFTRDEETFVTQFITRRPRSTESNGSGSGVHRSSSGRSHGGGGRRF